MNDVSRLTLETVVRRGPDQVSSPVEGEMAIMSVEQGNYYMLNEVGARFWQLIERPRSIGDTCQTLLAEFQTSEAQCEAEILRLAEQLLEQKLIEIVDEQPR